MKKNIIHLMILWLSFFTTQSLAVNKASNPILVIGGSSNFGSYIAEILRAEGINEFQIEKPSDAKITLRYLKNFDVVILSEMSISKAQKNLYTRYVNEGGNLIALRPDRQLSNLFGLTNATGTIENGYVGIDANTNIGTGLLSKTLQLHCSADKYKLSGASKIAALYINAFTASDYPGVTFNNYGKGHAIAFTYNLSKNIVLTRQGNPQFAGQEKDGINGLRAMDLFTDGWVDTSNNTINQADEQMRLLSHCIEKLNAYAKPLPRLWYFPDTLKCLITLTNDGESNKEADFIPQFNDIEAKGARMTLYILEPDKVSKAAVDSWISRGHEISGHPDDTRQAGNPDWNTMDSVISNKKKEINDKYGITTMPTNTNHWFVWCGKEVDGKKNFAAQAKIASLNGIELDCNYAHYDNGSNQGHFLGSFGTNQGNYEGSGIAMKFANIDGDVLNIYQHFNNVYDQQYMENKDSVGYYECFKGLMDRSLNNEVYSYISIKAHNAEYFFSKIPLSKMLDYANNKGIPVWTAIKLLDFLKAKNEATFSDISWSNNQLSFKINSSLTNDNGLTFMIPQLYCGKKIDKIIKDGTPEPYSIKLIKGYYYAFITIKSGSNYNFTINYTN